MTIRLLKFPSLALSCIFGFLDDISLFFLCQCSANTRAYVRLHDRNRYNGLKVSIGFQDEMTVNIGELVFLFLIEEQDLENVWRGETQQFGSRVVPIKRFDYAIHTIWPPGEAFLGLKTIAKHYMQMFNLNCLHHVDYVTEERQLIAVLELLEEVDITVGSIEFLSLDYERTNDALGNLVISDRLLQRVAGKFSSRIPVSSDFQPTLLSNNRIFHMDTFECSWAHWFNERHLATFNSNNLALNGCTLTSENINQHLLSWVANTENQETRTVSLRFGDNSTLDMSKILENLADPEKIDYTAPEEQKIEINTRVTTSITITIKDNNTHFHAVLQNQQ